MNRRLGVRFREKAKDVDNDQASGLEHKPKDGVRCGERWSMCARRHPKGPKAPVHPVKWRTKTAPVRLIAKSSIMNLGKGYIWQSVNENEPSSGGDKKELTPFAARSSQQKGKRER